MLPQSQARIKAVLLEIRGKAPYLELETIDKECFV
jgi:hypothetical protein